MPRQLYGLGGLLKSVTKGIKSAVKGVAKTVKKNPLLGLAALNFAPMAFGKAPFLGLGGGQFNLPGMSGIKDFFTSGSKISQMSKVGAAGGILTGLLAQAEQGDEEAQALTRNIPALKGYLFENYKNLGYTDQQAQELTDKDTAEYTSGMGGYAEGGRIGYAEGNPDEKQMAMVEDMLKRGMDIDTIKSITGASDKVIQDRINFIKYGGAKVPVEKANGGRIGYAEGTDDYENKFMKLVSELREAGFSQQEAIEEAREQLGRKLAKGGRVEYAMGSPEENAMQASGIMGIPLNQNPAGITELDLRETGGFIPPVGVKEKADDIPAMLSNNEFVFTADAVRGMGEGDVNKGAQRMYDMMKKLENGGRV